LGKGIAYGAHDEKKPDAADEQKAAVAAPKPPAELAPLSKQYSFALYRTDFKPNVPESSAAFNPIAADGSSRLTHFPLYGVGPRMDGSKSAWHRLELTDMSRAGVNVALIQYRPDADSQKEWGRRSVDMAAQAVREMRIAGQPAPALGLFLDFNGTPKLDLTQEGDRSVFYFLIHDFYHRIPSAYRAQISLPKSQDVPDAYPVFLGAPNGLKGWSVDFVNDLRARFMKDFGHPLALAGEASWKADAPNMDAYFALDSTKPIGWDEDGALHTVTLTPSYNDRGLIGGDAPIRSRMFGRPYVAAWNDAGNRKPDWILLNSWNDWATGTELAPSREGGDRELNLTRAALAHLDSDAPLRARLLAHNTPSAMAPGSLVRVEFRVENAGVKVWPKSLSFIRYTWMKDGATINSGSSTVMEEIRPRQENNVGILVPVRGKDGNALPEGDYQLQFSLAAPNNDGSGFGELSLGDYPVRVGALPNMSPTLLTDETPLVMEAGETYRPHIRIRNDGQTPWTQKGFFVTYRWLKVREDNSATLFTESLGEKTALKTPLRVDVPSGSLVDLDASVAAMDDDSKPLEIWTPDKPWRYELQWGISGPDGVFYVTDNENIEVVKTDLGVDFPLGAGLTGDLNADSNYSLKIVVKNVGPSKWVNDQVSIGYHWYYWDGTPMEWESKRVPVTGPLGELGPGEQALVRVPVLTPPFGGIFYLAADAYEDATWGSTAPVARGTAVLATPVLVKGGGFQPFDLSGLLNFDGVSTDSQPGDGDFDGQGHTFPGQVMPPLLQPSGVTGDYYPSGYMGPLIGHGLDANRRILFDYPEKQDGKPNFVECKGQSIKIHLPRCSALHLLMSSVKDDDVYFTVTYDDGTQQRIRVSMTSWDEAPVFDNESIGLEFPIWNSSFGVERHPVYLKRYDLECDPKRDIVQVDLPNDPKVKILAITSENW
jgi:hypothetical protein